MKNPSLLFLIVPFILLFFCVDDFNNPYDPQYDGDYRFSITWDSLLTSDTLEIFRSYTVPFAVTGNDAFSSFSLRSKDGAILSDKIILNSTITDSSISLYFLKPYNGTIVLHGVRPNNKEVTNTCTQNVSIVNPYKVIIDTLFGINDTVSGSVVKSFNSSYIDSSLEATWVISSIGSKKITWYNTFTHVFASQVQCTIIVTLADAYNNSIVLDTSIISIRGHSPKIQNVWLSEPPSLGDTVSFKVLVTDSDRDSIRFTAQVNDTSTLISSPVFYYYADTMTIISQLPVIDTGIAQFSIQATDKSGLSSAAFSFTDTIYYVLPKPVFDSTAQIVTSGKADIVSFIDENYPYGGPKYHWLSRHLPIDTTMSSNSISVTYSDTTTDTISVYGIDKYGYSGDTAHLNVIPRNFNYTLDTITWPRNLQARHWNTFSVKISPQTTANFFWTITPEDDIDTIFRDSNSLQLFVSDSIDPVKISVYAIESGGDTTNPISRLTPTVLNRPICLFTKQLYEAKAGETVTCSLNASDANGIVSALYLRFGVGNTYALGTAISFDTVFTSPINDVVYCWAVDSDGFTSDTGNASLIITSDNPYFNPSSKDTTVFVNDSLAISVIAYPGNNSARVDSFFWDINGDKKWDDTTISPTKSLFFPNPGIFKVYTGCINSFGDTAIDHFTQTTIVDSGKPHIVTFSLNPGTAYIQDTVRLLLGVYDTNDRVIGAYIDTTNDFIADITVSNINSKDTTITQSLIFSSPGTYPINAWLKDSTGFFSESETKQAIILSGTPIIDSVQSLPEILYVYDTVTITVYARDNGMVEKYFFSSDSVNFKDSSNTNVFKRSYQSNDSGQQNIFVKVRDNTGLYSDISKKQIHVTYGAPVIDSISIDTTANNLFVVDNRKYSIRASDVNGFIKKVYISWNGTNSPTDSIEIPRDTTVIDTFFTHSFDTSESGDRTVRFWVQDEDMLLSKNTDTAITVRLGTPVLLGDTEDTLWAVINNGAGYYDIHVNSIDTNGSIGTYFWDDLQGWKDTTSDSLSSYQFRNSDIDTVIPFAIQCKDDDGLAYVKQFAMYADSVPRALTIVSVPNGDSVKIMWKGKDYKDGDATQYRILLKQGASPDSSDILVDFKPGTQYLAGDTGFERKFGYKNGTTGLTYHYIIIARDARGSIVSSSEGTFIFP